MKKKLKIGFVTDQLLAGGVQLAAIEQIKLLNKLGHKAKLLILMRKKYAIDFSYLVKNVPHQYLSDSYPILFRSTYKFPVFSFLSTLHLASPFFAPKVLKKEDFDILISLGTTTSLTTQAIYKRLAIPYIAIIHDPISYILDKAYSKTYLRYFFPIFKPIARFFEKSFVNDAKQTLVISKVHLNYLKKNYLIEPKVLGFGTHTLNKLPKKRGKHLLSFSRWQKEKNPVFLLKLIKSLPDVKLIIAGNWTDPNELSWFRKEIKKMELQTRVNLIPHFSEEELRKICEDSLLWVYPHFEAYGLAALEAAGHGLPIIMPRKSGATENFEDGVDGYFPKKVDLKLYRSYIKKLLNNKDLAYQIGHSAWKKVRTNSSWRINIKNLMDIIYTAYDSAEKKQIVILETGHTHGFVLAGGDKLMEPMANELKSKYNFGVIITSLGAKHWQKALVNKKLYILPKNKFDSTPTPFNVFFAYCIRMWQSYQVLKNQVLKNSISLVYSSTNILPDVLPAFLVKIFIPLTPWVARIHHLIPPPHKREGEIFVNIVSYLMQLIALWMIKSKADIVIALNEKLKNQLAQQGFSSPKLRSLGGGIYYQKISKQSFSTNKQSFSTNKQSFSTNKTKPLSNKVFDGVFLGRLHITKGVFDTIPIWQEVVKINPKAKLAIIGGGPTHVKKQLEMNIESAHLKNNVSLLGFLPEEKLYRILKQSKVFLFLDHEAGWGLAVAEAMAAGLPVVGYETGVLGIVYHKGFIKVPLGNYKQFAKHLIKLLENKNLRSTIAESAKLEAKKFDWSITAAKFNTIINEVAK